MRPSLSRASDTGVSVSPPMSGAVPAVAKIHNDDNDNDDNDNSKDDNSKVIMMIIAK